MGYAPAGNYEGGERKAYFESAIPLILIAILAIFIAGKVGLVDLRSVPVIGGLFPASTIKVIVVGHASPELTAQLTSEEATAAGILYAGDIPQNSLTPGVLNQFDVVFMQGEQFCDRAARLTISDKVKGGGKLIAVGDACTKIQEDPAACGWDIGIGLLGDVMPATTCGVTKVKEPINTYYSQGTLRIIAIDHPIFSGVKNFQFGGYLTEVYPKANSQQLARLDEGGSAATNPAKFAILESGSLIGGKVIYFAFDPGTASRTLLLNTIIYLKGTKG